MDIQELGFRKDKIEQFRKKKIITAEELLYFSPSQYNDYREKLSIKEAVGKEAAIMGKVMCYEKKNTKSNCSMVKATIRDYDTGIDFFVIWFGNAGITHFLKEYYQKYVVVMGTTSYDKRFGYSITSPYNIVPIEYFDAKICPIYPSISGMSEEYLKASIKTSLRALQGFTDTIPEDVLRRHSLPSYQEACRMLHEPSELFETEHAKKRLDYEDMLYLAIKNEYASRILPKGSPFCIRTLKTYYEIIDKLPYKFTEDQQKVLDTLISDVKEGKRLNCLIQGDTSCGKTIVCFMMVIALAVDNGYQAAIMAPTEVLARQHYLELKDLLSSYSVKIGFYVSSMKQSEKNKLLKQIASGEIDIVIGTHALSGSKVEFRNLALTVIDEEHKFGVKLRESFIRKNLNGVHTITMSATPIPRTLAAIAYGDNIKLLPIRSMPNGRKRVKCVVTDRVDLVQKFLLKELQNGHQIYIACPAIESSDKMEDVMSVADAQNYYRNIFNGYGYKISTLTGKNNSSETEQILSSFRRNEFQILISTMVIEVGVNIPNATTIVIENAERFGLTGLHQLRGRVKRGTYQGYCIMKTNDLLNERLKVMMECDDGFQIAERDLMLRGAGDIIGIRQSGEDKRLTLMLNNEKWYEEIKKDASYMIDKGIYEEFLFNYENNTHASQFI